MSTLREVRGTFGGEDGDVKSRSSAFVDEATIFGEGERDRAED